MELLSPTHIGRGVFDLPYTQGQLLMDAKVVCGTTKC